MVVQHNIQALNANRMLGSVTKKNADAAKKLSSGYKINSAADDAAGLSISEKMRHQIRGLGRASNNAQDGVSLIQVAEGALNEVHSILQRMNWQYRRQMIQTHRLTETVSRARSIRWE